MSTLQKTRGFLLKTNNYAESSLIVWVFTEHYGVQSFIVNGVRKPKAKFSASLFQPLNLLELVFYHKAGGGLQRISEIRNNPSYTSIPFDVVKSTLLLFINEVLYKCLKEEDEEPQLFAFVFNSLQFLDLHQGSVSNFHLIFLTHLTRFLGFYPIDDEPQHAEYFDLKEGVFTNHRPLHSQLVVQPCTGYIRELMILNFERMESLQISSEERKALLHSLIEYYELHLEGFGKVKSLEVLQEFFA